MGHPMNLTEQRWTIRKSPQTFGGMGQVTGPDTDPIEVVPAAERDTDVSISLPPDPLPRDPRDNPAVSPAMNNAYRQGYENGKKAAEAERDTLREQVGRPYADDPDLVERVAQALCDVAANVRRDISYWARCSEVERERWRQGARAALDQ